MYYRIISLRGEVHTTSITLPFFIEAPVRNQESQRSCIYVLEVSIFASFYDWISKLFWQCGIYFLFLILFYLENCIAQNMHFVWFRICLIAKNAINCKTFGIVLFELMWSESILKWLPLNCFPLLINLYYMFWNVL